MKGKAWTVSGGRIARELGWRQAIAIEQSLGDTLRHHHRSLRPVCGPTLYPRPLVPTRQRAV
jgi:hypothetical protein